MLQRGYKNMDNDDILRIARESMRDNRALLRNLGNEERIRLNKNPDEEVIKKLMELMPKSTESKLLAVGAALLLAYILLKK